MGEQEQKEQREARHIGHLQWNNPCLQRLCLADPRAFVPVYVENRMYRVFGNAGCVTTLLNTLTIFEAAQSQGKVKHDSC